MPIYNQMVSIVSEAIGILASAKVIMPPPIIFLSHGR